MLPCVDCLISYLWLKLLIQKYDILKNELSSLEIWLNCQHKWRVLLHIWQVIYCQFGFDNIIIKKNRKKNNAGTASTPNKIFARSNFSFDFRYKVPTSKPIETKSNINHKPMLKDETEPSAKPVKKKYSTTKPTMASIPQSIQNKII
jgi:hypothetical protein